jgi:hypothetical protein
VPPTSTSWRLLMFICFDSDEFSPVYVKYEMISELPASLLVNQIKTIEC